MKLSAKNTFLAVLFYSSSILLSFLLVYFFSSIFRTLGVNPSLKDITSPEITYLSFPLPIIKNYSLPLHADVINYSPDMLDQIGIKLSLLGVCLDTFILSLFLYLFFKVSVKKQILFLILTAFNILVFSLLPSELFFKY